METFFPTSTATEKEQEILNLTAQVDRLTADRDHWMRKSQGYATQIENVKGYISDIFSMNGSVDEDIKAIAELLDITLTKTISGSATLEISWEAEVPIDFDSEDFEIGFDVECDTYEAENFEWDVVRQDIICEDENFG